MEKILFWYRRTIKRRNNPLHPLLRGRSDSHSARQRRLRIYDLKTWSKNISLQRKRLLFNYIFNSIVLYGCETWQLNTFLQRPSSGKEQLEKIPNDQIRQTIGVQSTIIEEIECRQLTWYGHVENGRIKTLQTNTQLGAK